MDGREEPAWHLALGAEDGGHDDELMRRVAAGSQDALASLYDRHAASIYRVALTVNRDHGVAEEIVQETFLALWNRAELFDPSLGSLPGWLIAIARNRALDRVRATARRIPAAPFASLTADQPDPASTVEWLVASGALVGAGAPEPGPELAIATGETNADIVTALTVLTDAEREAILLAYRDGLSQSEIAAHLGVPLGTVKTRSRRALRRLRAALEGSADGRAAEPDADDDRDVVGHGLRPGRLAQRLETVRTMAAARAGSGASSIGPCVAPC
jgi:RNA polymerase sigma-70 factor, ECF subfamily